MIFDFIILGTVLGTGISGVYWFLGLSFTALKNVVLKNN